jgi:hypothetical protein
MAGSITNGPNQIIASFQGVRLLPERARVRDIKVEIPATPLEPPDGSTSALSAFICVHLRPDVLFFHPNAKTKTPYWPQMNADERG